MNLTLHYMSIFPLIKGHLNLIFVTHKPITDTATEYFNVRLIKKGDNLQGKQKERYQL